MSGDRIHTSAFMHMHSLIYIFPFPEAHAKKEEETVVVVVSLEMKPYEMEGEYIEVYFSKCRIQFHDFTRGFHMCGLTNPC